MVQSLIIGLGAFLGANCRYLVDGWAAQRLGSAFPYGTMIVNVSGSFVVGLFLTLVSERFVPMPNLRLFFAVGFLGAYTTFSSLSFESLALVRSGAYPAAAWNLFCSVLLGMVAVALGAIVARLL